MKYNTIEELIDRIDRPVKTSIFDLYTKLKAKFVKEQGSQHNHQAWEGGYIDHVVETMNIARLLYQVMNDKRKLPFSLSDALVVLFLHDLEKVYPERIDSCLDRQPWLSRPKAKDQIRWEIFSELGIYHIINGLQRGGVVNVEGENKGYSNQRRIMSPLSAFCHMCDVASARIWFDRPSGDLEAWGWRESAYQEENTLWGI